MAVTKGRRQIIAALFLCAPRRGSTHLLPDAPTTVLDEAVDTVRPACDDPVERLWLAAMTQGLRLSHWRIETGGPAHSNRPRRPLHDFARHRFSLAAESQGGITCNLQGTPPGGVTVPEPCR